LRDDSFFVNTNPSTLWFWIALIVIAAQITLGGWVSTHYAGLACVDFPYCNGQVMPTMQWNNLNSDLITIHMLHRIGAMMTAIYLGLFSLHLFRLPQFRSIACVILTLLAMQITLGILNIVWLRPVWIALAHQGIAIILLLTIITALVKASFAAGKSYGSWIS
jgi:cytochrome c oxidase assembly protein subunit 15